MEYLVILGAVVNLLGTSVYIRDTFCGKTKPNRVTWLLWSVIPFIALTAELKAGIRWAALPVFIAGFTPLLVFVASFLNKQAYWRLSTIDYLCGVLSVAAIVLWQSTGEPTIAIALSILAGGLASAPTMLKAWTNPETETGATFAGGLFSALTGIAILSSFTFTSAAFLLYVIAQNGTMLFLIYRRRFFAKRS